MLSIGRLLLFVELTDVLDILIYGGVKRDNNGIGNVVACYLQVPMA